MSELCPNCPLPKSFLEPETARRDVEELRVKLDDPADLELVSKLPNHKSIIDALGQERPDRCDSLDNVLPGKRARHQYRRGMAFAGCLEIALAGEVAEEDYSEELLN